MDNNADGRPPLGPSTAPRTLAERIDDALVRLDSARDRPGLILSSAVLGTLAVAAAWWIGRPVPVRPVEDLIPQVTLQTTEALTEVASVVVHVTGAVRRPGVYLLDPSARVVDAVDAAGGSDADADVQQLNLAAHVIDGMQIRVPVVGEILVQPSTTGASDPGPVDVNRATAEQLERLPGVGPSTAAAIVSFRDANGPFLTVDDLLDVPGIGPAKLAGFADEVIIR